MRESSMRSRVVAALRPLHAVAVENSVGPGTPDVWHSLGAIELKSIAAWPARGLTAVAIPKYTPQQRAWARARTRAGGAVLLLVRVGAREWIAFDGAWAAEYRDDARRDALLDCAYAQWATTPTDGEILECVTKHSWGVLEGRRGASALPRGPTTAAARELASGC